VLPMRYELGLYIAEDDILHSHRLDNLKFYMGRFPSSDEGTEICTLLGRVSEVSSFQGTQQITRLPPLT
jgi:hypothetical protein